MKTVSRIIQQLSSWDLGVWGYGVTNKPWQWKRLLIRINGNLLSKFPKARLCSKPQVKNVVISNPLRGLLLSTIWKEKPRPRWHGFQGYPFRKRNRSSPPGPGQKDGSITNCQRIRIELDRIGKFSWSYSFWPSWMDWPLPRSIFWWQAVSPLYSDSCGM